MPAPAIIDDQGRRATCADHPGRPGRAAATVPTTSSRAEPNSTTPDQAEDGCREHDEMATGLEAATVELGARSAVASSTNAAGHQQSWFSCSALARRVNRGPYRQRARAAPRHRAETPSGADPGAGGRAGEVATRAAAVAELADPANG